MAERVPILRRGSNALVSLRSMELYVNMVRNIDLLLNIFQVVLTPAT